MPDRYTVRGIPASIAMDAWWLTPDAESSGSIDRKKQSGRMFGAARRWINTIGGLMVLILLADVLFWNARPGFSLAIFALVVFAVALIGIPDRQNYRKATTLMLVSILPVFEHVQLLSVSFLVLGTVCAIGALRVSRADGTAWIAAAAVRLVRSIPLAGILSLVSGLRAVGSTGGLGHALWKDRSGALWRNWAFPAGGTLVLASLLISANPVLEQAVQRLFSFDVPDAPSFWRVIFWLGMGLLVWPLITPPKPDHPLTISLPTQRVALGLNCGSVLRALLLFNGFLLIQSVLDISILFAGAALPNNMTYASYAHRGAYPLLVTAMLAGAFTFAAHPFLNEHRWIRPLLLLWVAQNVLLTLSAVLRLDLYISEYGLTYLRIYALIWMALVAIGLVVTLWHVLRGHGTARLLVRLCGLGFGTLYLCAFVNFAGIIVTHTLERANEPGARPVDWSYLCTLGPTADKALLKGLGDPAILPRSYNLHACHGRNTFDLDWHEWDFRRLRTRR